MLAPEGARHGGDEAGLGPAVGVDGDDHVGVARPDSPTWSARALPAQPVGQGPASTTSAPAASATDRVSSVEPSSTTRTVGAVVHERPDARADAFGLVAGRDDHRDAGPDASRSCTGVNAGARAAPRAKRAMRHAQRRHPDVTLPIVGPREQAHGPQATVRPMPSTSQVLSGRAHPGRPLDAFGPRSWCRPEQFAVGRLPMRATLYPFPDDAVAATLDRPASPWFRSLDGEWDFRLCASARRRDDRRRSTATASDGVAAHRGSRLLDHGPRRSTTTRTTPTCRCRSRSTRPTSPTTTPPASTARAFKLPARLEVAAHGAARRRCRELPVRVLQRRGRRHGQGLAPPAGVRPHRPICAPATTRWCSWWCGGPTAAGSRTRTTGGWPACTARCTCTPPAARTWPTSGSRPISTRTSPPAVSTPRSRSAWSPLRTGVAGRGRRSSTPTVGRTESQPLSADVAGSSAARRRSPR